MVPVCLDFSCLGRDHCLVIKLPDQDGGEVLVDVNHVIAYEPSAVGLAVEPAVKLAPAMNSPSYVETVIRDFL